MHKYLQSAAKAQFPEYTIAQSPRVTIAQSPRVTIAQSPRDTKSETPRHSSWAIFCCLPTSRLLLVRVVHQRVVRVGGPTSSPGRPPTSCPGRPPTSCPGRPDRIVVRVGGPNVTAACPYPALRLDKLYAALIRCLVLWTVTKQFLVSCFKGLYLLA